MADDQNRDWKPTPGASRTAILNSTPSSPSSRRWECVSSSRRSSTQRSRPAAVSRRGRPKAGSNLEYPSNSQRAGPILLRSAPLAGSRPSLPSPCARARPLLPKCACGRRALLAPARMTPRHWSSVSSSSANSIAVRAVPTSPAALPQRNVRAPRVEETARNKLVFRRGRPRPGGAVRTRRS